MLVLQKCMLVRFKISKNQIFVARRKMMAVLSYIIELLYIVIWFMEVKAVTSVSGVAEVL